MGIRVSSDELQRWVDRGLVAPLHPAPWGDFEPVDETISEKAFQADVEKFAKRHGWKLYHTRDSRKSEEGFPDLILLRGGRQVVAELKSATGEATPAQLEWLEAFRQAGAETFLWRPENWPEIERALR